MAKNENELSGDAIDDDLQDLEDPDYGIELDKVEIPQKPEKPGPATIPEEPPPAESESALQSAEPESAPQSAEPESALQSAEPESAPQSAEPESVPQSAESEPAPQPSEPESAPQPSKPEAAPPKKKRISLVFIVVPVCVILSVLGFFMIKTLLSFQVNEKKQPSKLGAYEPVEPMITNLGDDRHIEIALMIRSTPGDIEQQFILQSQAKHHIIMLVTSADIQRQLAEGVSEELVASYIHDEITILLKKNYPNQIILKDLIVR